MVTTLFLVIHDLPDLTTSSLRDEVCSPLTSLEPGWASNCLKKWRVAKVTPWLQRLIRDGKAAWPASYREDTWALNKHVRPVSYLEACKLERPQRERKMPGEPQFFKPHPSVSLPSPDRTCEWASFSGPCDSRPQPLTASTPDTHSAEPRQHQTGRDYNADT